MAQLRPLNLQITLSPVLDVSALLSSAIAAASPSAFSLTIAEVYLIFCPIGTPAHHDIMPSLFILAHGGARTTETELDEPKAWENDGLRRLSRALL